MGTMMLRNSERQTFKKCRHRWQWTYRDGRQSREAPTALRFGDLVHQALAAYYKPGKRRGPAPAATFERLYHEQAERLGQEGFDIFSDDKWVAALDLGVGMLEGYVERYAEEDKEYRVVASEQVFQLLVRAPERVMPIPGTDAGRLVLPPFRFKVVGTFDGVWEHLSTGRYVFKEFKTAAAINTDALPMDEQAGTYWTYGPKYLRRKKIIPGDAELSSILYTFLRKAVRNPEQRVDDKGRNLNQDGSVSKRQPPPFFHREPVFRDYADRERMHYRICEEARDILLARTGVLPLYKNPGPLHMPNCRGCSVREACEVHEAGGDFLPVLDSTMRPWNPYAAHELPERH